jgi:hypothetical protein
MAKQNKRSKAKYPALKPELNLKTRHELIADYDYIKKLSPEEKEWLNKFTKEYVNAEINTKKPRKNLHKTKAARKDCYDRNNARNRCIYTRSKASWNLKYLEDINESDKHLIDKTIEDQLNFQLDLINKKKK